MFADETALFKVVYDETVSAQVLNSDLKTIEEWAYQWKVQFNQAFQVTFLKRDLDPYTHLYCLTAPQFQSLSIISIWVSSLTAS